MPALKMAFKQVSSTCGSQ